ncbi:ABC transporter permease [Flavobacteriaceae bacterium F89]|uniref:ABC transporter permease n=1 Tax=Cerina litoralis TaxID=2874477 RepID=A0AAE3ESN8_9FLAO|nr:ABC transporter permease subunit [Cerina litoralis]MCG2459414.1 ABC transporter permease [Cerina litoralis]
MNYRPNKVMFTNFLKIGLSGLSERIGFKRFLYLGKREGPKKLPMTPFWEMVRKEITDHIRNWRFIILFALIVLTCAGTLYTALVNTHKTFSASGAEDAFFFLHLFSSSNGTLPAFFVFIGFLGPLFGISLGFDAINSEQNRGTLSRILAQPIPRDYVLTAKFVAGIAVISVLFYVLSFLVIGAGLFALGIPPTAEEFMRIMVYTLLSIVYVGFWLSISIFFSVRFRQPATSALGCIAVWLFFTVFYPLIIKMVASGVAPTQNASPSALYRYGQLKFYMAQVMPNELFSEITTTILSPSIRSLGPLTMEQMMGAIPGNLPLGQSLLLVWPQFTGLVAITLLFFLFSYVLFMKREIRSRA